jgi:glycosyltransferase involved in cell wall biosynthesis
MGVLEAFHCGVPIALSNVSSLPEVAGDAAIYFDPLREDSIESAIARGLTDEPLRRELVARGRARLRQFNWERCARETLRTLTEVR